MAVEFMNTSIFVYLTEVKMAQQLPLATPTLQADRPHS
jgi:hypothetical protein